MLRARRLSSRGRRTFRTAPKKNRQTHRLKTRHARMKPIGEFGVELVRDRVGGVILPHHDQRGDIIHPRKKFTVEVKTTGNYDQPMVDENQLMRRLESQEEGAPEHYYAFVRYFNRAKREGKIVRFLPANPENPEAVKDFCARNVLEVYVIPFPVVATLYHRNGATSTQLRGPGEGERRSCLKVTWAFLAGLAKDPAATLRDLELPEECFELASRTVIHKHGLFERSYQFIQMRQVAPLPEVEDISFDLAEMEPAVAI